MLVKKWPERKLGGDICLGRNTSSSGNRQDVREVRTQDSQDKVGSGDRQDKALALSLLVLSHH